MNVIAVRRDVFNRAWNFGQSRGGVAATLQTLSVNVLIIGVNAATGVITARALGVAGRGQYAAMVMWPQFLAMTLTLGLPSALIYHVKRRSANAEESRDLFAAALALGTLLGLLAALVGAFVIPRWMTEYPAAAVRFAQWTMLLMPVAALTEISIGAFRAREEFAAYNRLRVLTPVLTLIGFALLLAAEAMTPLAAATATLAACSFVGGWFTLHHVRAWRPRLHQLAASCRRLVDYGVRAWGNDLLVNLSVQADALLVVGLLSPAQMGLYVVALSLARMLNVFPTAVVNVLLPKVAGRGVEEVMGVTARAVRAGTLLAVVAGVGLVALAEPLLRLLYGAEFAGAIPVFRLLAVEAMLGCATSILLQPFLALGRPGVVSLLQGAGLALSVPLLLLLIPAYGVVGAGVALLVAGACKLACVLVGYRLFLRLSPPLRRPDPARFRREL
jgi:O-antigen/teichoic acid export membrane protein